MKVFNEILELAKYADLKWAIVRNSSEIMFKHFGDATTTLCFDLMY